MMACHIFHPGFLLILSGFFIPFVKEKKRIALIAAVLCLAIFITWNMPLNLQCVHPYLAYEVIFVQVGFWNRLFAIMFLITLFVGILFGRKKIRTAACAITFIFIGSLISALLADDMFNVLLLCLTAVFASVLPRIKRILPASPSLNNLYEKAWSMPTHLCERCMLQIKKLWINVLIKPLVNRLTFQHTIGRYTLLLLTCFLIMFIYACIRP